MSRVILGTVLALGSMVLVAAPATAGVFEQTLRCSEIVSGFCAQGVDVDFALVGPHAIVHPPGFDGTQPTVQVGICNFDHPDYPSLQAATQLAVAMWNEQVRMIGNCSPFCTLPEDPRAGGVFDAQSALLHELGHALGLGHPNLYFRDPAVGIETHTSFTAAHSGSPIRVDDGADDVRGSRDDFEAAPGGTQAANVHWFREDNNDPFAADGAVIDLDNYSRATMTELPPESSWASNANFCHGHQLGHPGTQSVTYSVASPVTRYTGLSADDVNMLRMQQTGDDRLAGTADDYALQLAWVADCQAAQVEIGWDPDLPPIALGETLAQISRTFPEPPPPLARHYTTIPVAPTPRVIISLNPDNLWSFVGIFVDGFETGDFILWSVSVPRASVRGPGYSDRERGVDHPYFCQVPPP